MNSTLTTFCCVIAATATIWSSPAWSWDPPDVLTCVGEMEASVNGQQGRTAEASRIQFSLRFKVVQGEITSVEQKYSGKLDGFPASQLPCSSNRANNLLTCSGGAVALWYYPDKKHGLVANINIVEIMKEDRGNAGYVYNYNCSELPRRWHESE